MPRVVQICIADALQDEIGLRMYINNADISRISQGGVREASAFRASRYRSGVHGVALSSCSHATCMDLYDAG